VAKSWKTILIYHALENEIQRCAKSYFRGKLIDIGCGVKPYMQIVAPHVTEHVGLDHWDPFNSASKVDLVGTADSIPADDASFDSALSTATLEHLAEPEVSLRECNRVLKPGGIAVYTVPLFWQLHAEPRDYYRFTKYGLQHIFQKAGFEIIEIKALAGFWTTFATMFCYYIARFYHGPMRYIPVIPVAGLFIQGIAYFLEKLDKAEEWTWMYLVVAKKK